MQRVSTTANDLDDDLVHHQHQNQHGASQGRRGVLSTDLEVESTTDRPMEWTEQIASEFEDKIGKPSREAIHSFFYPNRSECPDDTVTITAATGRSVAMLGTAPPQLAPPARGETSTRPRSEQSSAAVAAAPRATTVTSPTTSQHGTIPPQAERDRLFVKHFWTIYDDILILSIFTQIGIVFRLAVATWFTVFDGVFSNDSALFVNLPLNCLSSFLMGLFCSGEQLMEILATRFSPPRLQQRILAEAAALTDESETDGLVVVGGTANGLLSQSSSSPTHSPSNAAAAVTRQYGFETDTALRHPPRGSADDDDDHHPQCHVWSSTTTNGIATEGTVPATHSPTFMSQQRMLRRRRAHRRHRKKPQFFHFWEPPVRLNEELRDVQLLALERRIRASKCLLLFPASKQDIDVMEHYFQAGYQKELDNEDEADDIGDDHNIVHKRIDTHRASRTRPRATGISIPSVSTSGLFDLELQEIHSHDADDDEEEVVMDTGIRNPSLERQSHLGETGGLDVKCRGDPLTGTLPPLHPTVDARKQSTSPSTRNSTTEIVSLNSPGTSTNNSNNIGRQESSVSDTIDPYDQSLGVDQIISDVAANVQEGVSRLRRVNLADGWDAHTTPEAMSDDIILGLRAGFCGALSSFSSWNSAMVNMMREGRIGEAIIGYMLGLQLPIIAYRFGQHVAVYIFVWRCRFEKRRDERRGYGIRVAMNEDNSEQESDPSDAIPTRKRTEDETPSVRAIITAVFIIALVTQCTSLSFFSEPEHQEIALSLLFSPLGVLARWRLSQLNAWRPTFPLGTFICNVAACALSGGLGNLLAGNPGPRERVVLVSFIAGFAGTMSSLAAFVVEILAGIDPILFRFDGIVYAMASIFWAMVIGFIFEASADWADSTG